MTPPHDHDATSEQFAPVIPLRRRQRDVETAHPTGDAEPGCGGIWDPDSPPASLTARRSPCDPPTGAPEGARTAEAAGSLGEDAGAAPPLGARRRRGRIAAACGVLAAVTFAFALTGAGRPHATHSAKVAPKVAIRPSVTHAAPATRAKRRTHRVATRPDRRSSPLAKRGRKAPVHHAAVATSTHASLPAAPVSEPTPLAPPPTLTVPTPSHQTLRPDQALAAVRSQNASACVPGELGC